MSRLTRLSTAEFDRLVAEGSIREGSAPTSGTVRWVYAGLAVAGVR